VGSRVDVGVEYERASVEPLSFGRNIRNGSQIQSPVVTAAAIIATADDRKIPSGDNSSLPDAESYRHGPQRFKNNFAVPPVGIDDMPV